MRRSWSADGTQFARYWSRATSLGKDGLFYYWEGEWPTHQGVPPFSGRGQIRLQSKDRASGYFTTRSETNAELPTKLAAEYLRAQPEDLQVLDGADAGKRAQLIAKRIKDRSEIPFT